MSRKLKGIVAAPGIAIAPLVRFHTDLDFIPVRQLTADQTAGEIERLDEAVTTASRSILALRHELSKSLSVQDTKIYDAQLALLHDPTFKADMVREIETGLSNVEVALQRVVQRYQDVFERMQDAAMRERGADVRDIGRQLLSALMEKERFVYTSEGKDYIFVADEFLPSDAGLLDRAHVRGIVTARGGKYSHGAILARSLGIPALVAVEDLLKRERTGILGILDGENGQLVLEPDEEELATFRHLLAERQAGERRVYEVRVLPSVTTDGSQVHLLANVESVRDLDHLETDWVAGIGLFRTEFAFMERRQFPGEDDQFGMYKAAIESAAGKVVTFRTLDVGGDKPLSYFRTPHERNPVLGWRGIRIALDWPDILYTQCRAILRASAFGHARILLPMITTVDEVKRCREAVRQIVQDLRASGIEHDADIEVGIMVEVPATVFILDQILPLVDFVSVGTNDLTQYLLAVDRDNPRVASMYDPYHPAVLRALARISQLAGEAGKPASICGEIAGDHYYTPLLLGLGYRELSMAAVFLPRVKLMVRSFGVGECEKLAAAALQMGTAAEVRRLGRDVARERWKRFVEAHPAIGGSA